MVWQSTWNISHLKLTNLSLCGKSTDKCLFWYIKLINCLWTTTARIGLKFEQKIIHYGYFLEDWFENRDQIRFGKFLTRFSYSLGFVFFFFLLDIFREDEPDVIFPTDPCTALSTLRPPPVPEWRDLLTRLMRKKTAPGRDLFTFIVVLCDSFWW